MALCHFKCFLASDCRIVRPAIAIEKKEWYYEPSSLKEARLQVKLMLQVEMIIESRGSIGRESCQLTFKIRKCERCLDLVGG